MQDAQGKRTLAALKWSYGGAVARVLAQLVVQTLLARLLGPEAFGQAMAAFLVLAIGWILSEGGFGAALVQQPEITDADIGYALGWVLLISGSAGIAVMATATWLAPWMGGPELTPLLVASGALIPVQALSNIPASLMRRNLDMRRSQLIYMGAYLGAYGLVGLPMAMQGAGAWSLITAFAAHTLLNLAGSYAVVRHTLRPRLSGHAALRAFGLKVTATNIAGWIGENVDKLVIQRLWGVAALGEYSAAATLSRAPANFLVSSVQSVLFAATSRLQEDPARAARSLLAVLGLLSLVTFPVFVYLALQAAPLFQLLYGERWHQAAPLFAVLCLSLPSYAILSVTGPVLWAFNAVEKDLHAQLLSAGVLLVGFLLLAGTPLTLAIWLVPAVYTVRAAQLLHALTRHLPVRPAQLWQALRAGAVLSGVVVVCTLAARATALPPYASAILAAALGTLGCLLSLRAAPQWMWGTELRSLLLRQAAGSPPLRTLCRTLRLSEAAG